MAKSKFKLDELHIGTYDDDELHIGTYTDDYLHIGTYEDTDLHVGTYDGDYLRKSVPYEEYFGEMDIPKTAKNNRIKLAELLEEVFDDMMYLMLLSTFDLEYVKTNTYEHFIDALDDRYIDTDNTEIVSHVKDIVSDIVEATQRHLDDEYFTSNDRAMVIAENEANTVLNWQENQDAISNGMTYKIWMTERDDKVRDTHALVDELKIPVNELFNVGNSLMAYPKDFSHGASPTEIINCRCTIRYSKN